MVVVASSSRQLAVWTPRSGIKALADLLQRVHVGLGGMRGGLVMRHPSKPLLDKGMAYRAGAIGLGLLPIAMAFAAVLIP
ncbi:hypothetical protein AC630_39025 [Bradyrhizobium sp. AS23.2]|nr:hypothetical protein AC630_39025 [Bradyrhizobium sp. AS23.2]